MHATTEDAKKDSKKRVATAALFLCKIENVGEGLAPPESVPTENKP